MDEVLRLDCIDLMTEMIEDNPAITDAEMALALCESAGLEKDEAFDFVELNGKELRP